MGKEGTPIAGWFLWGKIHKWMIGGGSTILGNHQPSEGVRFFWHVCIFCCIFDGFDSFLNGIWSSKQKREVYCKEHQKWRYFGGISWGLMEEIRDTNTSVAYLLWKWRKALVICHIRIEETSEHGGKTWPCWWFGCHQFYFPINIWFLSSSQLTNSCIFQDGVAKKPPVSLSFTQQKSGHMSLIGS